MPASLPGVDSASCATKSIWGPERSPGGGGRLSFDSHPPPFVSSACLAPSPPHSRYVELLNARPRCVNLIGQRGRRKGSREGSHRPVAPCSVNNHELKVV